MEVNLSDLTPFWSWFPGALLYWLLLVAVLAVAATLLGWLFCALRYGPIKAVAMTSKVIAQTVADLLFISPRRVLALSWLAFKESVRRRVLVVFGLFIVVLLFAGWYLDPQNPHPARLYLDFVLTSTGYLILLLALFLSALSLPTDFKNKTIQTIVTKPVRTSEIVLGRVFGFAAVGTVLLVLMSGISYVFVLRGLAHTHTFTAEKIESTEGSEAEGDGQKVQTGRTSFDSHHSHGVTLESPTNGYIESTRDHWHRLTSLENGKFGVGPAEGMLQARVPVYGTLTFRDRSGQVAAKGINVGKEWDYRTFIEGGGLGAAVWQFQDIREQDFPKGLLVETVFNVFRTYLGDMSKGLPVSITLKNPVSGKSVEAKIFEAKEYATDSHFIPRELQTATGEKVDLFDDLVDNGNLEIWLRCLSPGQYIGVAQADLYLRAGNNWFALNFFKGYVGIWLQMMLIISLGVFFSTFLSTPVALLATSGMLVGGFFREFLMDLSTGKTFGGGPFESFVRMLTQENITLEMEGGLRTTVVQTLDRMVSPFLELLAALLPNFGNYNFSQFVAYGFDIPSVTLLQYTFRMFAFVLPVFVAAYLCLKLREVAK